MPNPKKRHERLGLLASAKINEQTRLQIELALGARWKRAKEKIGGNDWLAVFREAVALTDVQAMVDAQAEDAGLWFQAMTAPEAYLQQELRSLHAIIERYTKPSSEDADPSRAD